MNDIYPAINYLIVIYWESFIVRRADVFNLLHEIPGRRFLKRTI